MEFHILASNQRNHNRNPQNKMQSLQHLVLHRLNAGCHNLNSLNLFFESEGTIKSIMLFMLELQF